MQQRPIEPENECSVTSVDHAPRLFDVTRDTARGELATEDSGLGRGNRLRNLRVLDLPGMAHAHGEVARAYEREVHSGRRADLVDPFHRVRVFDRDHGEDLSVCA